MKKPVKRSQARRQPAVTLADLVAAVCRFRDERDWAEFHTPKNLAAAVAIEAAELQERFLWKTDAEVDRDLADAAKRAGVADEIADVVMFAMLLADRLGIDLAEAITAKLAANTPGPALQAGDVIKLGQLVGR